MPKALTISELSEKYPVPEHSTFIRWEKQRDWFMVLTCDLCGKERRLTTQQLGKGVGCQCQWHAKMEETNLIRYGHRHAMSNTAVAEKAKASITPEVVAAARLKRDATMMERYGVKYATQLPEISKRCVEKAKSTCLERYGHECSMQNEEVKAKRRATCLEKYGYENAAQHEEVLEKMLTSRDVTNKLNQFRSSEELELAQFVQSLGLRTKHHAAGSREIDILIPELNIGIEYNGLFWHSEGKKRDSRYHLDKKSRAKAAGIDLIQIWSDLWMQRKVQVQNFLRAKLGKCDNRIGVRKCDILEVPAPEARAFIDANHIQGAPNKITLALGAYKDGQLLAVATFAPHHRGCKNPDGSPQMVLNRLCTLDNWVVSGFLGKAVRIAFSRIQSSIVSWVDLMWSDGGSYIAAGFKLDEVLPPDYCYTKGRTRIPKQQFRKIDERTELQRAADEKVYRLWDCGKLRMIFSG